MKEPPKTLSLGACRLKLQIAFVIALLAAGSRPVVAAAPQPEAPVPVQRRAVCIRGTCFDAEIAVTAAERERGLMHRETLAPDRGMLFVFPREGRHGFWMKNTLIELDIVFIGADRRVVSIARRARPCPAEPCDQYTPTADVAFALEMAGGRAAAFGFAVGDLVEFPEADRDH